MIPKIGFLCFLIFAFGMLCRPAFAAEQIRVVENGKAGYRIMIDSNAPSVEEFAAQELQGYIMQISGAFLPLDKGIIRPSEKYILIGSGAISRLGLRINEEYLGPDGFILKSISEIMVIVGGSPRGTLFGVYTFLERLGCRWMAPGIIGEVIPQTPNVVISSIEYKERPNLIYRGFTNLIQVTQEGAQWIDWMAKNRMNYLMCQLSNYGEFKRILGGEIEKRGMYLGVNLDSLILDGKQTRSPENEKKDISEALKKLTSAILNFVAKNPEVDVVDVPVEIIDISQEQYLRLITDIRAKLKEQYPDKSIRLMIHSKALPDIAYSNAETVKTESSIQHPVSRKCYRHSIGDKRCKLNQELRVFLDSYLEKLGISHIYEYYMGSYSQNSLPFPILNTIAHDLEYFNNLTGVEGVISQCEPGNWGTYGLNYYIFARISWNTNADLGTIVDDYCDKYYGSASEPMKNYYSGLEDAMLSKEHFFFIDPPQLILEFFDRDVLSELDLELRNAEGMADDAIVFDRIRKIHLSLNHAKLLWNMLSSYSRAIQSQDAGNSRKAKELYKESIETGEKLIAFLFQNVNEGVFIIPESYIFDYLQAIIGDARNREMKLKE